MTNEDLPDPSATSAAFPARRLTVVLLAIAVTAVVVVGFVTRNDDEPSSSSPSLPSETPSSATPTTIAMRAEITARLREILDVRDKALLERDPELLSDIYTTDCKCLEDGRVLIMQLRKEGIVWKGVETSVTVRNAEEVNERLWILTAVVATPLVRVETESGRLVRTVPPEQNLVRFALAKPQNEEEWLLGHASIVD
jgi:hypothetical protein